MIDILRKVHLISVVLFLLLYVVKTALLLMNKNDQLEMVRKRTLVGEMIISTVFLATGIWLFVEIGAIKPLQIIKLVAVFAAIPLGIIGFKRKKKVPALLSTLLIVNAYGLAEMSKKKPYPPKEISEETKKVITAPGQKTYMMYCEMCHGADGKKGISGASDLTKSTLNAEGAWHVINYGRKNMPAYEKVLPPDEVKNVAEYIQALKNH